MKNKTKETTFFILLNLFGAPFTLIVMYALLNWYGLVADIILFFVSYKLWKISSGNKDARLSFCPKIKGLI